VTAACKTEEFCSRCGAKTRGGRAVTAPVEPAAAELRIVLPLVPPSVNHYVLHTRAGRHYQSKEAVGFKQAIAICGGPALRKWKPGKRDRYTLEVWIYLGFDQRGDGDNFWKVIADGLVGCGAIRSDAAVDHWLLHKGRDRQRPRTEIVVRVEP